MNVTGDFGHVTGGVGAGLRAVLIGGMGPGCGGEVPPGWRGSGCEARARHQLSRHGVGASRKSSHFEGRADRNMSQVNKLIGPMQCVVLYGYAQRDP